MEPLIKIDLNNILTGSQTVAFDLGCGRKKRKDSIGIDQHDLPGVDIVADMEQGLDFLPDNCADFIYSRSFLEHTDNFEKLMKEIVRILKPAGRAEIFVPHFSNPYYYSDFTHKRFFGLYTFYYFSNQKLKRKVPDYYTNDCKINILSLKLIFRSPFWFRAKIKSLFGHLVNSCSWMQEYYEENLCYMFPCHGIEIAFTPEKTDKQLPT